MNDISKASPAFATRGLRHPLRPRAPAAELALDRRSELIDTLWVTTLMAAILFNPVIGPLSPLIVIASLPIYAVLRWERLPTVLADCWPLLLLPAAALISVFWSSAPAATLRYGTLYLITAAAGIIVGAGTTREGFLKGLFWAFASYNLLSFLSGRWVAWGPGGVAFAGLAGSKNSAGDIASLTLLVALATLFWSWPRRQHLLTLCALATIPISLFILWFSKATGALIGGIVATICLLLWTLSRRLPTQVRVSVFIVALLVVVGLLLSSNLWLPPLFEAVLETSGKDAGLTGRADLWRKADTLIAERPWLGLGYNAFWLHNNLDAEYLWRMMGIGGRGGFNFHNTAREITVHLGFVGLVLFATVGAIAAARLFTKTMVRPALPAILACAIFIAFLLKLPFEVVGFSTVHFGTALVFALLAMGMLRTSSADIQDPPRVRERGF